MRIIYLHQYFTTPDMAGGTRSYEMGRRLVAAGHSVDMVTTWQGPSDHEGWFVDEVAGMRVHWLPLQYSNKMSYADRIQAFFKFALHAAKRAASLQGDVVFATSTPLTIALPAVYAARRMKIPMVFEVRDLWPELPIVMGALKNPASKWAARRLEAFAYANAAEVVALSPGMAAGVKRSGYPAKKITVIPNGADIDMFKPNLIDGGQFRTDLNIHQDQFLIGYAGTLGRINGVSYLVNLAEQLKDDSRFHFLIVGDGQEHEQITRLAQSRGVLGKNLTMINTLPKNEMPKVLSALDIATSLVLPIPELEANSANKFFDALAAGCCVAINYGGWQAQLLAQANAGIRLSNDPTQAAQTLRRLGETPTEIRNMGARARQLAQEQFPRDKLAAALESVLMRVSQTVDRS